MFNNDFGMGYNLAGELVPLFKEQLLNCKVNKNETVVIFSDSMTNPHYPSGIMGAAREIGCDVFQISVPYFTKEKRRITRAYGDDVVPSKGPLEAMQAADIVFDVSTIGWLYSHVHNEILKSGTRVLMVAHPPDILRRLLPLEEVKIKTVNGANVLQQGKKIRMTSEAGTDLTFDKTNRKALAQYGAADEPGRWDNWPSGQVGCAPLENSAEGVLILDVGDIILRLRRYVSAPIRCEFKNGKMISIEGGLDAFMLREYMQEWEDEKAYIPAHIGWGTEHRAVWIELALPGDGGVMDAESYYGDVLLGMGANYFIGLGGENVTSAHIDFCLRNHNFWVDDLQVLEKGSILPKDLK
jgi:2,5-dihydroxypyridine 5,6-dioxygenase